MRKIVLPMLGFILLLICIITMVYGFHKGKEDNRRESDKEVNRIIQQEKNIVNTNIVNTNTVNTNTDVYTDFLKNYNRRGEEYYYSYIYLDGYDYPILLLSDGVYSVKNDIGIAMCTDIYYPVDNEVTLFGDICSNGTAYPISTDPTSIYTAGGHEVAKYSLDFQNHKLKLISKYIMFFHKEGEKVNAISIGIIGDENKIVSEDEFDKAYKEYVDANEIYFKRLSNNQ